MKKIIISLILIGLLIPLSSQAALQDIVRGMILLQVEANGEAWYVNPVDNSRYYMKDGQIAYQLMRNLSLGITDSDLQKIPAVSSTAEMKSANSICPANSLANRLKGKILLQVQQNGEAWYIYPKTCRRIYLKDGLAAYEIMRYLGLGITNVNLALVPQAVTASDKFLTCLETQKYNDIVLADLAIGKSLGVSATPTPFFNQEKQEGYMVLSVWESLLNSYQQQHPGQAMTIETYSDFQCPFCSLQAGVFDQLLAKYENLTILYRHFPLYFHDQAMNAALASECAREQGKFKAMHDALFALTSESKLIYDNILIKAGELGL